MPRFDAELWRRLQRIANREAVNGFPDEGLSETVAALVPGLATAHEEIRGTVKTIEAASQAYRATAVAARERLFWSLVLQLKQLEMLLLQRPVRYLQGVGPARAALLGKKGVTTLGELLHYYPRTYLDRRRVTAIGALSRGEGEVTVSGRVQDVTMIRGRRGKRRLEVLLGDETGSLRLTWFHAKKFQQEKMKAGTRWLASGRLQFYRGWQLIAPELVPLADEDERAGRMDAVYPETQGLTSRTIRRLQTAAWQACEPLLTDPLPQEIVQGRGLVSLRDAMREIHFPEDPARLASACRRLKYQELFLMQLALGQRRRAQRAKTSPRPCRRDRSAVQVWTAAYPFALTAAQQRALAEIIADMQAPYPMYRLLQGDVGSGKTAVAVAAAVYAKMNGQQAAFMVPTELLAAQHYQKFAALFREHGIRAAVLTGSLAPAEKRERYAALAAGEIDIVFGTHALLQAGVAFASLGLVIIDEQHRFGVLQRSQLQAKGMNPDQLVMTATPIPRTLAMTVYGDMDVSLIDELPPGRQPIVTEIIAEQPAALAPLMNAVTGELDHGHQAYVVFPLIEDSADLDVRAATSSFREWQQSWLAGYRCGLLHGRLPEEEKRAVMDSFRRGATQVLFSTTVIEVGVDVPAATVMVVWDAHRFGVAQLHQLRGRVGRGPDPAHCYFVYPARLEPEKKAWLRQVAATTDGFAVARLDLQIRGQGEFLGTRQHGLPELQLADILADTALLFAARADVDAYLASRPEQETAPARRAGLAHLQNYLQMRYGDKLQLLEV